MKRFSLCLSRPSHDELFDLEKTYEHIWKWNQHYVNECIQREMRDAMNDGDDADNRGLRLAMKSWRTEKAKRVLGSRGFVVFNFEEMFDDVEEENDATTLCKR